MSSKNKSDKESKLAFKDATVQLIRTDMYKPMSQGVLQALRQCVERTNSMQSLTTELRAVITHLYGPGWNVFSGTSLVLQVRYEPKSFVLCRVQVPSKAQSSDVSKEDSPTKTEDEELTKPSDDTSDAPKDSSKPPVEEVKAFAVMCWRSASDVVPLKPSVEAVSQVATVHPENLRSPLRVWNLDIPKQLSANTDTRQDTKSEATDEISQDTDFVSSNANNLGISEETYKRILVRGYHKMSNGMTESKMRTMATAAVAVSRILTTDGSKSGEQHTASDSNSTDTQPLSESDRIQRIAEMVKSLMTRAYGSTWHVVGRAVSSSTTTKKSKSNNVSDDICYSLTSRPAEWTVIKLEPLEQSILSSLSSDTLSSSFEGTLVLYRSPGGQQAPIDSTPPQHRAYLQLKRFMTLIGMVAMALYFVTHAGLPTPGICRWGTKIRCGSSQARIDSIPLGLGSYFFHNSNDIKRQQSCSDEDIAAANECLHRTTFLMYALLATLVVRPIITWSTRASTAQHLKQTLRVAKTGNLPITTPADSSTTFIKAQKDKKKKPRRRLNK